RRARPGGAGADQLELRGAEHLMGCRPGAARRLLPAGVPRLGHRRRPSETGSEMTLRILLATVGLLSAVASPAAEGPLAHRGYYLTFMRMPTYDLEDWKRIVDGVREDGGDTLMLWT